MGIAVLLINVIQTISFVLVLLVLANSILSFFMSPYHPVRRAIGQIVDPLLNPIRSRMPAMAGLDFSPLILIILIQIVEWLIVRLLVLVF